MFQNNLLMASAGAAGGFVPLGVNFDGTNDYMNRAAAWTGASDSAASWTVVFWVNSNADGSEVEIHQGVAGCFDFLKRGTNKIEWLTYGPGCSGFRNRCTTTATITSSDGWVCVMSSSNGSTNQIYFGDTDVTSSIATSTSTEDNTSNSTWGAPGNLGAAKWNGDLAELYVDIDNRTDFSVEANRRRFFSDTGTPVDLGDDGSEPSGSSPICYLSVRKGGAATDLLTNRGTGGNYTEGGSLTLSSTNPGD